MNENIFRNLYLQNSLEFLVFLTEVVKILSMNAYKKIFWLRIFNIFYLVYELLLKDFVYNFQAFWVSELF